MSKPEVVDLTTSDSSPTHTVSDDDIIFVEQSRVSAYPIDIDEIAVQEDDEDLARRLAQEERDRELALKLTQELNKNVQERPPERVISDEELAHQLSMEDFDPYLHQNQDNEGPSTGQGLNSRHRNRFTARVGGAGDFLLRRSHAGRYPRDDIMRGLRHNLRSDRRYGREDYDDLAGMTFAAFGRGYRLGGPSRAGSLMADFGRGANGLEDNSYEGLLALSERIGVVKRGLTRSEISQLPTLKYKTTPSQASSTSAGAEDTSCTICMCDYEPGDDLMLMPLCLHKFHKTCIETWFKENRTCPVCRMNILQHDASL